MVGGDYLWWKTIFSGRQPSVDPCMLPSLLYGIFCLFLAAMSRSRSAVFSFEFLDSFVFQQSLNLASWKFQGYFKDVKCVSRKFLVCVQEISPGVLKKYSRVS